MSDSSLDRSPPALPGTLLGARSRLLRDTAGTFATAFLALLASSCSIRTLAVNTLADAFAETGDVFASDDDPQLVRDALPFALKTMEGLLAEVPENENLLLSCCQGFTQYSSAFVEADAERLEATDYLAAEELRGRALRLYMRARDYGLRGLEVRHPGIGAELALDPEQAVLRCEAQDVPLLFWTGAAWGSTISLGLDRPEILADVDAVRSLLKRTLELDESFEGGAVHEAMVVVEALPALMGGSMERARLHFDRALELSEGRLASPYVTLASAVLIPEQDRPAFEDALRSALALDPDAHREVRLANLIAQERARVLLARADDLFLEPLD